MSCISRQKYLKKKGFNKALKKGLLISITAYVMLASLNIITPSLYIDYQKRKQWVYEPESEYAIESQRALPKYSRWYYMKRLAEFAKGLPEGTQFAMSEYGYIGAMANHVTILDIIGLHDPGIAHNGFSLRFYLINHLI